MSEHGKGLGRLQDTSWHIGYVTKKEDDPRRHRSRCYYHRTDGSCQFFSKCIGSAHCRHYKETQLIKQKKEYKSAQKALKKVAPPQPDKNIVQLNDIIEVFSVTDQKCYPFDLRLPLEKLPRLPQACLGRKIGSSFEFLGEQYQIRRIFKPGEQSQFLKETIV